MLSPEQINEIHRLHLVEKWSQRRIARHLRIGRHTLAKYLDNPAPKPSRRDRASKLDTFKPALAELLEKDPQAPAPVLLQRLQTLGYDGGITILKDYLLAVRKNAVLRRAYVRMEPSAGERFDIDWGHFGALLYNGTPRKLYAFCLVECHSRKMYLEFTHSQTFETFVRCHIHAFAALGGCARELWFDNLATAVAEHEGNLVRFNPRFLAFARECGFIPRACHVAAAWEKGKVERAIGYVRQNFWPLRSFADLSDVNSQARRWLQEIANQRKHRETGQAPDERFQPDALRPLPFLTPDYRDSTEALVHKDLRLTFDGNRYCVPPRYVGHKLTVKADSSSVTIYDQTHEIVCYARCWERGQTFGAFHIDAQIVMHRHRSRGLRVSVAPSDGAKMAGPDGATAPGLDVTVGVPGRAIASCPTTRSARGMLFVFFQESTGRARETRRGHLMIRPAQAGKNWERGNRHQTRCDKVLSSRRTGCRPGGEWSPLRGVSFWEPTLPWALPRIVHVELHVKRALDGRGRRAAHEHAYAC